MNLVLSWIILLPESDVIKMSPSSFVMTSLVLSLLTDSNWGKVLNDDMFGPVWFSFTAAFSPPIVMVLCPSSESGSDGYLIFTEVNFDLEERCWGVFLLFSFFLVTAMHVYQRKIQVQYNIRLKSYDVRCGGQRGTATSTVSSGPTPPTTIRQLKQSSVQQFVVLTPVWDKQQAQWVVDPHQQPQ